MINIDHLDHHGNDTRGYVISSRSSSRRRSRSRSLHHRKKGHRQASLKADCRSDFYDRSHYYPISDCHVSLPYAPVPSVMSTHVALTDPISQPFKSGVNLTTTAVLSAPRVSTTIPSRKTPAATPSLRDTWVKILLDNMYLSLLIIHHLFPVLIISVSTLRIVILRFQRIIIWCRIILISFLPLAAVENWQHQSSGIGQDGDCSMLTSLESQSTSDHMVITVSRSMPDGIGQGI
ncbi:hypothetical protein DPMN_105083 [Dreissena polymorpha]|uniref:Uncharacterized protein n=1 Tax=Dreissena polymorpha TaxID=45954 RepID=A0A9D4HGD3_DREPO|nr:hypothetical protein DPMN_105083 [Dreissena polymorpha]